MKTLFLMAILFFLVVLAVKEPDQSAWDAARDIGSRVDEAVSEIKESTVAGENIANPDSDDQFFRKVREALDTVTDPAPSTHEIEHSTGPGDSWTPTPPTKTKPTPVKRAAAQVGPETPPGLPAIPMTPVEVGDLGAKTPPRRSAPAAAADRDYAEIKKYYENASRLLAEIK